ncbi:phosphopantetheine-binding protein [Streptomyces erythrochromogenes]|uniref:phosphopantetheine-binding protein n=1 Tax=Streptomyces erythrochromogenes TaxID=285574 RepID=UPI0033230332
MDEIMTLRPCVHEQRSERCVGVVIGEIITAASNARADESSMVRLRALVGADEEALRSSPAELGVDSLTWLEVLTALEGKFGILFSDAFAASPDAHTVLGLSRALADCLRDRR